MARYGGEEFLAILPETTVEGARDYCECIRVAIEQFGKMQQGGSVSAGLTISGGATGFVSHRDTFESFLKRADQALYTAKQNGRNRVVVICDSSRHA